MNRGSDQALFTAPVSALGNRANLEKPNEFQFWRTLDPVALEEGETIGKVREYSGVMITCFYNIYVDFIKSRTNMNVWLKILYT